MAGTQSAGAATVLGADAPAPLRFEVTVISVADVDRAKAFYAGLGWRLDADFPIDPSFRIVQFTPPASRTPPSSIWAHSWAPASPLPSRVSENGRPGTRSSTRLAVCLCAAHVTVH